MTPILAAGDIIDRSAQFYRAHLGKVLRILSWYLVAGLLFAEADALLLWSMPRGSLLAQAIFVGVALPPLALLVFTVTRLIRLMAGAIKEDAGFPAATWRAARGAFGQMALALFGTTVLIALGAWAFIVPGIIFMTWFAFAPIMTALGATDARHAFAASRALSEGRFFAVFWRVAAPTAFFFLLQAVLHLLTTLVLQGAFRGIWSVEIAVDGAPLALFLLVAALQETVSVLLLPLFIFATTLAYLALSDAKPVARTA